MNTSIETNTCMTLFNKILILYKIFCISKNYTSVNKATKTHDPQQTSKGVFLIMYINVILLFVCDIDQRM